MVELSTSDSIKQIIERYPVEKEEKRIDGSQAIQYRLFKDSPSPPIYLLLILKTGNVYVGNYPLMPNLSWKDAMSEEPQHTSSETLRKSLMNKYMASLIPNHVDETPDREAAVWWVEKDDHHTLSDDGEIMYENK